MDEAAVITRPPLRFVTDYFVDASLGIESKISAASANEEGVVFAGEMSQALLAGLSANPKFQMILSKSSYLPDCKFEIF